MINVNNIETLAEFVGNILGDEFTPQLNSMARGSEWSIEAAYDMQVAYDEGDLDIQYSEEMSETIDNFEYGDINSLPKSVIRPFIYRAQPHIEQAYRDYALDILCVEGGLI